MLINITFISILKLKRLDVIAQSCGFNYMGLVNPTFAEYLSFQQKLK